MSNIEKAEQSLSSAEGLFWQDYDGATYAALCIADAQAHATLALAEQQRAANLIAWYGDSNNWPSHLLIFVQDTLGIVRDAP